MIITPNLKAFNYDLTNILEGVEPIPPQPAPSTISVSPITDVLEVAGEYTYAGGSPEKWVSDYDANMELFFSDTFGYWVIEYFGSPVLKQTIASDGTQPPTDNWTDDGGIQSITYPLRVRYGTPSDANITVSGAGNTSINGTYEAQGYRQGSAYYKHNTNSSYLWAYNDYASTADWVFTSVMDDASSPDYFTSDDPYYSDPRGLTWGVALGTPPAPTSVV